MNTAEILCKINTDFYRKHADSFSMTRQSAWHGWARCLDAIGRQTLLGDRSSLAVFDLACGNLRFEAFLEKELPGTDIAFYTVDNCDSLVAPLPSVAYQHLDVVGALLGGLAHGEDACDGRADGGKTLSELLEAPLCDLSVAFGFMHHVPCGELREELLATLVDRTHAGGYVVVSFWQFLNDETLAGKAQAVHAKACEDLGLQGLDENDFLLGWKNLAGAYRYCHSFSDEEIDRLVESVVDEAVLVSRFRSDGRTDNLNTYVVFQVR